MISCANCGKAGSQGVHGSCEFCGSNALDPYLENPFCSSTDAVLLEVYKTPLQIAINRFVAGACMGAIVAIMFVLTWLSTQR